MATITRWSAEEIKILKRDYFECGAMPIALALGRSEISIRHKASKLGLKNSIKLRVIRQAISQRNEWLKKAEVGGIKDGHAWKREILRRGNYTCIDCGLRDPNIVISHHVIPKNENPSLSFDLSNGVVLCPNCHAKRHIQIGRKSSGNRMSDRDKELIMELTSDGKSINEIAMELGFNHKTIQRYFDTVRSSNGN